MDWKIPGLLKQGTDGNMVIANHKTEGTFFPVGNGWCILFKGNGDNKQKRKVLKNSRYLVDQSPRGHKNIQYLSTDGRVRQRVHRNSIIGNIHVYVGTQSCPALCDPVDCSPPGSSVQEILQARILEWVAMPSSRGSSEPRSWICVSYISCIGRQILYHWATWEALSIFTFTPTIASSCLSNYSVKLSPYSNLHILQI